MSLPARPSSSRSRLPIALLLALSLPLGGCLSRQNGDVTGSIATPTGSESDLRREAESWGARFERDPGEKTASMTYARLLRALDQKTQAAAVLERAALRNPRDRDVVAAYGKALAEAGRLQEAAQVLERAHTPERPDWSILSVQGAVADQMGDSAEAQKFYEAALKIAPDEPSVLSNLGFSYALNRRLSEAEALLRRAAQSPRADPRIRQNLVLVLGLQGRFAEAEEIARKDLPPIEAAQNIAYLRQLVSQPNAWQKLREGQKGASTRQGG